MAFDINDPADVTLLAAKVQEAVATEVVGLKAKNTELIEKEKKHREALQVLQAQVDGLDITALKELQKKLAEDEDTQLLAKGEVDKVIEKRVKLMKEDHDKTVKVLNERLEASSEFVNKFRNRVLSDAFRSAAVQAGAEPTAIEDIVLRAQREFVVNEAGEVVKTENDTVVLGKDGKTPLQPLEWLDGVREKAPHLWPKAAGGNASGPGGKVTKAFKDMDDAERIKLHRENPAEYARIRDADKTTAT